MTRPSPSDPTRVPVRRPWRGRIVVLLGVVLVAFNLRIAVTAVSPIIDRVGADVPMSDTIVGLLGTAPVVMFALAGFLTPILVRRIDLEPLVLIGMALTAVGEVLRSGQSGAAGFLALSCVAFFGMGMGNVLLPPLIKRYFPDRIGVVTAAYTTLISISAAVPPLFAVQLANRGGWRLSVASWAVVAAASMLPWAVVLARAGWSRFRSRRFRDRAAVRPPQPSRSGGHIWRSPVAWGVAVSFAVSSINFYAMLTWLPQILTDAGYAETASAHYLSLYSLLGAACGLVVPLIVVRARNPYPIMVIFAACFLLGDAGLLWWPQAATALWVIAAGLGPGAFPFMLTLINVRSRTSLGSAALSGFAQGAGYLLAAPGPLLVGFLFELTDGWLVPFAFLAITAIVMIGSAAFACRPRFVEDEWGGAADSAH